MKSYETEKGEKHFELYLENLTQSRRTLMKRVSIINCIHNYFLVVSLGPFTQNEMKSGSEPS